MEIAFQKSGNYDKCGAVSDTNDFTLAHSLIQSIFTEGLEAEGKSHSLLFPNVNMVSGDLEVSALSYVIREPIKYSSA